MQPFIHEPWDETSGVGSFVQFLGKRLFPGKSPWQQRTQVLLVLRAAAGGVLTGALLVALAMRHG